MSTTLYKKDNKGKLRIWTIHTSVESIIEEYGLVGGKLSISEKIAIPKNVGKSNETSGEEQAILEMKSKIAEKLKKDYYQTAEEAENTITILPMLAKSYDKEAKKVVYPCFVQPKLDGMRALYHKSILTSRQGSNIDTMMHITHDIANSTHEILDGELYAHGVSFQENMKLIKKYRTGESESVKYHVYDLISDDPFSVRYKKLTEIAECYSTVKVVDTFKVNNEEELKKHHTEFLRLGYEGTIIRWGTAGYKMNGRSSNLLKYKDFKDIACEIIDVIPMEARPDQGVVVCKCTAGEFKATPKMSHEERKILLTDKNAYIGKTAEIRYFENTDSGLPRFPVFIGIRLDK